MKWIKNIALICVSSLLPLLMFVSVDLLIGLSRMEYDPSVCKSCERNELFREGWYELKPNFDEQIYFPQQGRISFRFITDKKRYRVGDSKSKSAVLSSDSSTDLLFLGDSFTLGSYLDWEDTFVGLVEQNSTEYNVINGGNVSYSVTPYNYIYSRYLRTRDSKAAHLVAIAVDLSDVQDEAGYWRTGADHPVKTQQSQDTLRRNRLRRKAELDLHPVDGYQLNAYLPYLYSIWGYVKFGLLKSDEHITNRVAFTYKDWQQLDKVYPQKGYLPLGVAGGIEKVESGLKHLLREIERNNGKAFFIVYPWPNQMVYEDTHFDWSEFIQTICEAESCSGVIDLFPVMREYKQNHPTNWYTDLYITGEYHFNAEGNRLIAEHVLQFLDAKKRELGGAPD